MRRRLFETVREDRVLDRDQHVVRHEDRTPVATRRRRGVVVDHHVVETLWRAEREHAGRPCPRVGRGGEDR